MRRGLELDLLRRLLDLHQAATTSTSDGVRRQPTSVYVDPQRHRAEVETLLRGPVLVAALGCELDGAGSYLTVDVGLAPVLVVRQAGGDVRAFLNACRHRGSAVASGRGHAPSFTCPYHGWTYEHDGRLRARPLARGAFDDIGCEGLIELPCREVAGLVVVGTEPGRDADLSSALGGYADELASHDLASYRLVGDRSRVWPFNWKLGVETFMESYHVFTLHRATLAQQLRSAPMLSDFDGRHGRGVVMGKRAPELLELSEAEWDRFQRATWVYWLFPNTVISMPQSGHVELWTFVPADDRPDRSLATVRFYAAPSAPQQDEFWARLIEFTMSVIEAEDFGQQVIIQRNVATGLLPEVVFGRNEPALRHFHEQLDAALAATSEARRRPTGG